MTISKECGAKIISSLVGVVESSEPALLELYFTLINSEIPSYKIVGSKYLLPLLRNAKSKEEIGKMLETVFNDSEDLTKIFALNALVEYYDINSNMSLTKFKNLSLLNSWRVNIKICEYAPTVYNKLSKSHFKLIFEPMFFKFLISTEPELRAAACSTLIFLAKSMSDEEIKAKLVGALKKLGQDSCEFVKSIFYNICSLISKAFDWDLPSYNH